mmetsp:Transcript_14288/g.43163  ORF Transcript_14288/g.43163 Transcript_14288/m.43163 type:complete len:202 (+) Transcript_14288:1841-2446(+)
MRSAGGNHLRHEGRLTLPAPGGRGRRGGGGLVLDPQHMKIVDVARVEGRLAVCEVEPVFAPEAPGVAQLQHLRLPILPRLPPRPQGDCIVRPNVRHLLHPQAGAPCGCGHGAHGRQMPAREDVLPDEIAACAVRRVPLIRLCYHLDDGTAPGLEGGIDGSMVGDQMLLTHRLYHLAAQHPVEAARWNWDLPVVAKEEGDAV